MLFESGISIRMNKSLGIKSQGNSYSAAKQWDFFPVDNQEITCFEKIIFNINCRGSYLRILLQAIEHSLGLS